MKLPKLIITDIDGVWTDGGMYYDQKGNEFKKFNSFDGAGVFFCKKLIIPIAIVTGEDTNIIEKRAKKLKIEFLYQGVTNKVKIAEELKMKMGIRWEEIAFIGDDLGDIQLLKKVGFSAAPQNAPEYVRKTVHYVTMKSGGEGAFREFIEKIIGAKLLNAIINKL